MRARQRWPDATESELSLGQQLFVDRCQDCHDHPDVTFLPEDEWPSTMRRMSRYAKLEETEGRAVLRFVLTSRGQVFGHRAAFDETERPIELRPDLPGPPAPETEGIDLPSGPPPAPTPD